VCIQTCIETLSSTLFFGVGWRFVEGKGWEGDVEVVDEDVEEVGREVWLIGFEKGVRS